MRQVPALSPKWGPHWMAHRWAHRGPGSALSERPAGQAGSPRLEHGFREDPTTPERRGCLGLNCWQPTWFLLNVHFPLGVCNAVPVGWGAHRTSPREKPGCRVSGGPPGQPMLWRKGCSRVWPVAGGPKVPSVPCPRGGTERDPDLGVSGPAALPAWVAHRLLPT